MMRATQSPLMKVSVLLLLIAASAASLRAQEKKTQERPPAPRTSQPPAQKPPKEEMEDAAPPNGPVPRVGDEDADTKPSDASSQKGQVEPASDLLRAAQEAASPEAKNFFQSLGHAHDILVRRNGQRWPIPSIPQYMAAEPTFTGEIEVQPFDNQWKLGKTYKFSRREVLAVEPYERVVIHKVDDYLKSNSGETSSDGSGKPSSLAALQDSEKALVSALRFHLQGRERGRRQGPEWSGVEKELATKLRSIRLEQLRVLTNEKKWEPAFALATRLADDSPNESGVQLAVVKLLAEHASQSFEGKDFLEARKRLSILEERFPDTPALEEIRAKLKDQAESLVKEAKELEKQSKPDEALARLNVAETIYPRLPGLHDYLLRLDKRYPILRVGVRDLPQMLSPATAVSDSEKQAVELIFEGLLRLAKDPRAGMHYAPDLTVDLPRLLPLGREFQLVRNAYWSDGRPVTATDVRKTVSLLKDRLSGYGPSWSELVEGARTEGDAFHIRMTLKQGFFEPLFLMSFKVLPESLQAPTDQQFARAPIGSGPYRLDRQERDEVVFTANPYYEARPDKGGLPRIREIRFLKSKDPIADFQKGRIQLLLDISQRKYRELESSRQTDARALPNRRIYFLAVNHRSVPLQNQNLRRAIAHGIDRESILNTVFRNGDANLHRLLNGPYPPGSWACQPNLPADPFNAERSKAFAEGAKSDLGGTARLVLKYPEDDSTTEEACKMIRDQVTSLDPSIVLVLEPRSVRDLHRDVEIDHNYDLAYYAMDYPTQAYWLWPMFDPAATKEGGTNIGGYKDDSVLESLFRKVMAHRDFAVVQSETHRIHQEFYEKMPFIPLWQLDTLFAVDHSLKIPEQIDPLRIFADAEHWSIERQ
jgi:ABC-type oligopeptide transport system substrate-binding subunit